MDDENLYALTNQFMMLQNLYKKRQLDIELKSQRQLLNGMKESLTVLEEITSLPTTDIVVQKDQPFLEIDRKSGCLRDIKENVLEAFAKNLNNINEIKLPENLEISVEKVHMEIQEQKEKNKSLNCLLDNFIVIPDGRKSEDIINIDDISCIKPDSGARDLFNDVDDGNETVKDMN